MLTSRKIGAVYTDQSFFTNDFRDSPENDMECYNCGASISNDAARCPRCGQRFKSRETAAKQAEAKPTLLQRLKQLFRGDR